MEAGRLGATVMSRAALFWERRDRPRFPGADTILVSFATNAKLTSE